MRHYKLLIIVFHVRNFLILVSKKLLDSEILLVLNIFLKKRVFLSTLFFYLSSQDPAVNILCNYFIFNYFSH